MDQVSPNLSLQQTVAVARCDRWQMYQRLQELGIACACLEDGRFQVDVTSPIAAMQIWSVSFQLTASRQQLVNWLERCR